MAEFRRAFIEAIKRYGIWALVLGVIGGFALWVLDQILGNAVTNFLGSNSAAIWKWIQSNPVGSAIIAGVTFFVFCCFVATRDELIRKYAEFVREPDSLSLAVIWRPGEPVFVHRYTLNRGEPESVEFRVCIKNTSQRTTLRGIRVRLENLNPHNLPCAPCCLRLMNNTKEPFIERFDLDPDDEQAVSVFVQNPGGTDIYFLHTTPGIPWTAPGVPYSFDIVARCESARARQHFNLIKNGSHWEMKAINA